MAQPAESRSFEINEGRGQTKPKQENAVSPELAFCVEERQ